MFSYILSLVRYTQLKIEDEGLTNVKEEVRDQQKAVFDHLFYKAPEKFNEVQQNFHGEIK